MNITTSDPGTGAVLTPACKTHGLYFNDSNEPENFKYLYDKDVYDSIVKQVSDIYVGGSFDSVEDYFDYHVGLINTQNALSSDMSKNNIHVIEIPDKDSFTDDDYEDDNIDDEE